MFKFDLAAVHRSAATLKNFDHYWWCYSLNSKNFKCLISCGSNIANGPHKQNENILVVFFSLYFEPALCHSFIFSLLQLPLILGFAQHSAGFVTSNFFLFVTCSPFACNLHLMQPGICTWLSLLFVASPLYLYTHTFFTFFVSRYCRFKWISLPLETQWRCLWSLWKMLTADNTQKNCATAQPASTSSTYGHSSISRSEMNLSCVCARHIFFSAAAAVALHFFIIYIRLNLNAQIQMVAETTKNHMKMIAWNIRQNTTKCSFVFSLIFFSLSNQHWFYLQLADTISPPLQTLFFCGFFPGIFLHFEWFEWNALDVFCCYVCNTFISLSDILNFSWHKSKWSLQVKLDEFEVFERGNTQQTMKLCTQYAFAETKTEWEKEKRKKNECVNYMKWHTGHFSINQHEASDTSSNGNAYEIPFDNISHR